MVAAIDNKDGYTRQHSEEVTEYSREIARAMEPGEGMLQTIRVHSRLTSPRTRSAASRVRRSHSGVSISVP